MPVKTARLSATHDNRIALLGWAPPLFALALLAGLGVARHAQTLAPEKSAVTPTETSTVAGAGAAIVSHASFH